jgi:ribosomal protein S4
MNRVRFLLGLIPLRSLVSIFKKSQKLSNPNKTWKFVGSLESLLPIVCLKMGLSSNMLNSIQLVQHSKIGINGEFNIKKDTSLFPGDIIHFKTGSNSLASSLKDKKFKNKDNLFNNYNEFIRLYGEELHSFFRVMWNFTNHRRSIIIPLILFLIKQKKKGAKRKIQIISKVKLS